MKKIFKAILLFVTIFSLSCSKDEETNNSNNNPEFPTVTTTTVSNITPTSASCGGNITAQGTSNVTSRGVCFSTTENPTITNSITSDGTGTGTFSSILSSLTANTLYHVRAYATNSAGTAYGNDVTFTTLAPTALTAPVLSQTTTISNITQQNITVTGTVISDGGSAIIERGICYSLTATPTISDYRDISTGTIGSFTITTSEIYAETVWHIRPYATNSIGTSYGAEVSPTTEPLFKPGSGVTDIDGNVYTTVILAGKEWMRENLKTTKYNDGTLLTNITDNLDWQNNNPETGSWCYYSNNASNNNLYGKLYDFYAASNPKLAPNENWHVSSFADWKIIIDYLNFNLGDGQAAYALKALNQFSPLNGNNKSNFNGLPGGSRKRNSGGFQDNGTEGYWWTSDTGKCRRLSSNTQFEFINPNSGSSINGTTPHPGSGLSIRCVKN